MCDERRGQESDREGDSQLGSLGNNVKRSPRSFVEEARPGQAGTGTGDGFGGSQMPKGEV